jgi:hypothetical protein
LILYLVYTLTQLLQYMILKACDWIPESELEAAQYTWHDKYSGVVVYEQQVSLVQGGLDKCIVRRYIAPDDSEKDAAYQVLTLCNEPRATLTLR